MTPRFQFRLDLHSGVPVYRQIMDQVRTGLASGGLRNRRSFSRLGHRTSLRIARALLGARGSGSRKLGSADGRGRDRLGNGNRLGCDRTRFGSLRRHG